LAEKVKSSIARKYPVGSWVLVSELKADKFGKRYDAVVKRWLSARFVSASDELLENERWAVPYEGGEKTKDWCAG
jgi:hypothetical protein